MKISTKDRYQKLTPKSEARHQKVHTKKFARKSWSRKVYTQKLAPKIRHQKVCTRLEHKSWYVWILGQRVICTRRTHLTTATQTRSLSEKTPHNGLTLNTIRHVRSFGTTVAFNCIISRVENVRIVEFFLRWRSFFHSG